MRAILGSRKAKERTLASINIFGERSAWITETAHQTDRTSCRRSRMQQRVCFRQLETRGVVVGLQLSIRVSTDLRRGVRAQQDNSHKIYYGTLIDVYVQGLREPRTFVGFRAASAMLPCGALSPSRRSNRHKRALHPEAVPGAASHSQDPYAGSSGSPCGASPSR